MNYKEYLQSEDWAGKRREKLHQANYKCEVCGRDDLRLDVHHRTYERLGNEWMSDLQVLCRYCHKVNHGEITFETGGDPNEPF
jgi:5-methylcytosine-specific restriction endonuclease McrA